MITTNNIGKSKIPKPYNEDVSVIIKAINVGLYNKDKEVKKVVDNFINSINNSIALSKNFSTFKTKKSSNVLDFNLKDINTDTKRFQNRSKLNKEVLDQIIKNYNPQKLDAVVIWKDKNNKYYLLAGHHRLEATKKLNLKTIPARIFTGSEKEAIKYAKVESNSNRSLETPLERANIYRTLRLEKTPKAEIEAQAKKFENKNASTILNLSFLQKNGLVEKAYKSLEKSDVQNRNLIEKIADWIGNARRLKPELTSSHEKEMFDFLMDKNASKRFSSKVVFLQKINSITGGFDFDKESPLNLKKFKYETEGEKIYNTEFKDLKERISKILETKADLNSKAVEIQASNVKDKKERLQAYENRINEIKKDLTFYNNKLIELQSNKGKYINSGSNQAALFGSKPQGLKITVKEVVNDIIKPVIDIVKPKEAVSSTDLKGFNQPTNTLPEVKKINNNNSPNGIISTEELMNMDFDTLNFTGSWSNFLENPARNMKIAIWGKPKNGKTVGACQLANYLTNFGRVLYNFADQGINASTQKIWNLTGLSSNNKADLSQARSLDELEDICKTGNYSFIFIDMINTYIYRTNLKPHEFEDRFIKQFPNISFILIFEVTKSGNFKGDQAWTHLPDALVTVENYVMNASGRYGVGHHIIWHEQVKKQNPSLYEELTQSDTPQLIIKEQ